MLFVWFPLRSTLPLEVHILRAVLLYGAVCNKVKLKDMHVSLSYVKQCSLKGSVISVTVQLNSLICMIVIYKSGLHINNWTNLLILSWPLIKVNFTYWNVCVNSANICCAHRLAKHTYQGVHVFVQYFMLESVHMLLSEFSSFQNI